MASSKLLAAGLLGFCAWSSLAKAQQLQGFAVERLYLSAPGAGWFVMDDLNFDGKPGGALALTTGYARNPLVLTGPDGRQRLAVVSNQAFAAVAAAVTYRRYRVYLDLPMPLVVTGRSGTLGPYQVSAPAVNLATSPDTISDLRLGFDMRLMGKPGSPLRFGAGAQLIVPSGDRASYVTDGRYRGMFRFLVAGDMGRFSYAGHVGLHVRPQEHLPFPDDPNGNEFLFGISAGRTFSVHDGWAVMLGPEFYGETAVRSFFNGQTGAEGLLTGRLEQVSDRPHMRLKAGIGYGLVQHFGAPQWRIVLAIELVGPRRLAAVTQPLKQ
jgi:hypothetical protein